MLSEGILFIDLETENHAYFGAIASPKHPGNYVVAVGQRYDGFDEEGNWCVGERVGQYYESKEAVPETWLNIPDSCEIIVAHNAPFEMDWFLTHQREQITAFLKRGGKVFCTAYAEYLLSNQQDHYPALTDVAPRYGGTKKVDAVKVLWEQGRLTSEIDKALLFDEYLMSDTGDVENTATVFYGQQEKLHERGMWDMAMVRMEGQLFLSYAQYSGMHISRDVAWKQKEELEELVQGLVQEFEDTRAGYPEGIEFKETSHHNMSAWMYGGPIPFRMRKPVYDEDGNPVYANEQCYVFGETLIPRADVSNENFSELEAEFGPVKRVKSGKKAGEISLKARQTAEQKLQWADFIFDAPGIVDLDLLPSEIKKGFLEEYSQNRTLKDGSPVISTSADALDTLAKREEFPDHIRDMLKKLDNHAKANKDLTTYYLKEEVQANGRTKKSGMLQYLTEHDIVYHILNYAATVTGRYSSSRPNMQNIPRGDTSNVKKVFTSRFDNPVWLEYARRTAIIGEEVYRECIDLISQGNRAGAILEADYTALEVVNLAAFSKDRALVKALVDGIDMHCFRLAKVIGEAYEEVLEKCKNHYHPEHAKYYKLRTDIKPRAFAYQYGATARGIAYATGCSIDDAQAFIDAEKTLFPEVEEWYSSVVFKEIHATRTQHREQTPEGKWTLYHKGTYTAPGGTCYEFREYPSTRFIDRKRIQVMEFKPTQMRNYPIQGESGYFVQGIAGRIVRWLIDRDFFGRRVFIINQVHDAIYLDCCVSVLEEVARTVKDIMEALPEYFNTLGYDLDVPFPAEVEAGESMFNKEKIV